MISRRAFIGLSALGGLALGGDMKASLAQWARRFQNIGIPDVASGDVSGLGGLTEINRLYTDPDSLVGTGDISDPIYAGGFPYPEISIISGGVTHNGTANSWTEFIGDNNVRLRHYVPYLPAGNYALNVSLRNNGVNIHSVKIAILALDSTQTNYVNSRGDAVNKFSIFDTYIDEASPALSASDWGYTDLGATTRFTSANNLLVVSVPYYDVYLVPFWCAHGSEGWTIGSMHIIKIPNAV